MICAKWIVFVLPFYFISFAFIPQHLQFPCHCFIFSKLSSREYTLMTWKLTQKKLSFFSLFARKVFSFSFLIFSTFAKACADSTHTFFHHSQWDAYGVCQVGSGGQLHGTVWPTCTMSSCVPVCPLCVRAYSVCISHVYTSTNVHFDPPPQPPIPAPLHPSPKISQNLSSLFLSLLLLKAIWGGLFKWSAHYR